MNYRGCFLIFSCLSVCIIFLCGIAVYIIDPYFHYRKPLVSLYYELDNQRYINDGIIRRFDYNAIITGTSMSENFKKTEYDDLYGVNSIKVPFSGASFKEINDNLANAYESGHRIDSVVRSLEPWKIIEDKNHMRNDLGGYPEYLYNDVVMDDFHYLLNKDVVKKCLNMTREYIMGNKGGITNFDEYSNWNNKYKYGKKHIKFEGYKSNVEQKVITESDKEVIKNNVEQNIVNLARLHPETIFYCFFTPCSVVYWGNLKDKGDLQRELDAIKYATEIMTKHPNIKLFSFNSCYDIITNLDNYKDEVHYGEWINSKMLIYMKDNQYRLTRENYTKILDKEQRFLMEYPYESL